MRQRRRQRVLLAPAAIAAGLSLGLSLACAAQQSLLVLRQRVYLPQDGVALNLRTGWVAWRFPSFQGNSYSRHGVLIVAYLAQENPRLHIYGTRVCRLDPHSGAALWCRLELDYAGGWLGSEAQHFYLLHTSRLDILRAATGERLRSMNLPDTGEISSGPLAQGGLAVIAKHRGYTRGWEYRAAWRQPWQQRWNIGVQLIVRAGNAMLYAPRQGELWRMGDSRPFWALPAPFGQWHYPRIQVDRHGFWLSSRRRGGSGTAAGLIAGGRVGGKVWTRTWQGARPRAWLDGKSIALLRPLAAAPGEMPTTQIESRRLKNDRRRWQVMVPGGYRQILRGPKSWLLWGGKYGMALLDKKHGRLLWRLTGQHLQPMGMSAKYLVGWDKNYLECWALGARMLLWRVRFRLVGPRQVLTPAGGQPKSKKNPSISVHHAGAPGKAGL